MFRLQFPYSELEKWYHELNIYFLEDSISSATDKSLMLQCKYSRIVCATTFYISLNVFYSTRIIQYDEHYSLNISYIIHCNICNYGDMQASTIEVISSKWESVQIQNIVENLNKLLPRLMFLPMNLKFKCAVKVMNKKTTNSLGENAGKKSL